MEIIYLSLFISAIAFILALIVEETYKVKDVIYGALFCIVPVFNICIILIAICLVTERKLKIISNTTEILTEFLNKKLK